MAVKIKPHEYQKEGVWDMEDFLEMGGGTLLADDMGLGKTLQTLWLLRRETNTPMFPALVVCPAGSVKYAWEHTAAKQTRIRAQVLEGRTPPETPWQIVPKLIIINPEILKDWSSKPPKRSPKVILKSDKSILSDSVYLLNSVKV